MANYSLDLCIALTEAIGNEGMSLYYNYLLTRNLEDLNQAVLCARIVLHVPPHEFRISHLGRVLLRRFQNTRQAEDLKEAIESLRHAVQLFEVEGEHHHRELCLIYLGIAFQERDDNFDDLVELNVPHELIGSAASLEALIRSRSEDEEVFTYFREKLEKLDGPNFSNWTMGALDAPIQLCRQGLAFFCPNSGHGVATLMTLGEYLWGRFEEGKDIEDANESIECGVVALQLEWHNLPENLPLLCEGKALASKLYLRRFYVLRRQDDLENAFCLSQEAVEVLETNNLDRVHSATFAKCLHNLSGAWKGRYDDARDVKFLNAAIDAESRAVDISTAGDQQLSIPLNNLVHLLQIRLHAHGERAEDLIELTAALERVLISTHPQHHSRRVYILLILWEVTHQFYFVSQDPKFFDRAIQHLNKACYIYGAHPEETAVMKEQIYHAYAVVLSLANPADGTIPPLLYVPPDVNPRKGTPIRAVDAAINCVRLGTTGTHYSAAESGLFLSKLLYARWMSTSDIKDLEEAISALRHAVELADVDPKLSSGYAQYRLGVALYDQYKHSNDAENREEALLLLVEVFRDNGVGLGVLRVMAANAAIDILIDKADWEAALKVSQEVIDMFVILNGRFRAWEDKQYLLQHSDSQAATYTSVGLEAGRNIVDVVDMLETCRGLIIGHAMDKRADLDELMKADPEKASLFKQLQDEINTTISPDSNTEGRMKEIGRRIEAEREIRACIVQIRSLTGFDRFLLGPTEAQLKAAAARGPIVIVNVTKWRSDAIIITKDAFDSVALPNLELETVQLYIAKRLTEFSGLEDLRAKNKEYRKLQGWLWDNCVQLILQRLKHFGYGPAKFHMWWIGVGVANFLPFHVAGKYGGKGCENALLRVTSSYAATLRVLIHSQQKLTKSNQKQVSPHSTSKQQTAKLLPRLTIITMPSTPGMEDLDGAKQEAHEIQAAIGETFFTQNFVKPCAKETKAYMVDCDIIHFACHGESNVKDPSLSRLLLQATAPNSSEPILEALTLRDIVAENLGQGKLAFLSACSTAENRNPKLQDEILHLVSGFQVAGYVHSIGNLWPADDDKSADLVKDFYERLMKAGDFGDGDHVAEALNEAVLGLATKHPRDPLSWAQYVHFGV